VAEYYTRMAKNRRRGEQNIKQDIKGELRPGNLDFSIKVTVTRDFENF
jgi:hypothetical protein